MARHHRCQGQQKLLRHHHRAPGDGRQGLHAPPPRSRQRRPGSIHRTGANADFTLLEQGKTLNVVYQGSEPPPDTFKDDAQALAVGTYGHDGVFHATQLQAKCASKYAPVKPAATTTATALPADFKK